MGGCTTGSQPRTAVDPLGRQPPADLPTVRVRASRRNCTQLSSVLSVTLDEDPLPGASRLASGGRGSHARAAGGERRASLARLAVSAARALGVSSSPSRRVLYRYFKVFTRDQLGLRENMLHWFV